MIRIAQVRVVDEEGAQLGVMPTAEALAMAQERGYDLVEVAPMASPPVARFLDFGQYKYELTKREKEAKRKQRSVTFKEVRLKPKIGIGDFDTKVRRAIEFLEEGDRIKVAVQFRGRELTHPEIGRALLEKFTDKIKDHGLVERQPLLEGKSMHITVASTHKPKVHEAPAASTRAAIEPSTARPAAALEPTTVAPEPTVVAPEPTTAAPQPTPAAPQPTPAAPKPVAPKPATAASVARQARTPAPAAEASAQPNSQKSPRPEPVAAAATSNSAPTTKVAIPAPAAAPKPKPKPRPRAKTAPAGAPAPTGE
jgi:translation initiation factor IF-3